MRFSFRRPPPDPVQAALDKVERQNRGMLRAAHTFALLLVIATSVASLISLAGDLVQAVFTTHHFTLPQATSLVITFVLVMAMDTGSLYGAAMVRVLRGRRAPRSEQMVHLGIMGIVSALEAGTYTYMLVLYERPHDLATWLLVVARGLSVPLLALYLAMAQPISVTPADIARESELITGKAVLKALVTLADDPNAKADNLSRLLAMYAASADLSAAQRDKLKSMFYAAQGQIVGEWVLPPGAGGQDRSPSLALVPVPTFNEDQLRARMLHEGYPLPDLDQATNGAIWHSLTAGVRRAELQQLTELSEAEIVARLAAIARDVTERP